MQILFCFLLFAVGIHLITASTWVNHLDTDSFRVWGQVMAQYGMFTIYISPHVVGPDVAPVNYGPLALLFIEITGKAYQVLHMTDKTSMFWQMLILKFFQVIFTLLCGMLAYLIGRRQNEWIGVAAAVMWFFNPSLFVNSTIWGQNDSMLIFFILLGFWLITEGHPIWGTLAFAATLLIKYQTIVFIPILLLELFVRYKLWKTLKAILIAAVASLATFVPFMAASHSWLLPYTLFKNNLFPASTSLSVNAMNFYTLLGFNLSSNNDTLRLVGPISYHTLSLAFIGLCVLLTLLIYWKGKNRSLWFTGLVIMQIIFMFTTGMHERYQIIVLPFAFMSWLITRRKNFFAMWIALTVMTCWNQMMVMFGNVQMGAWYSSHTAQFYIVGSAVNLLLLIWTVTDTLLYIFSNQTKSKQDAHRNIGVALAN